MRRHLLDRLACRRCGRHPLSLEVSLERELPGPVPTVRPCESYCAHEDVAIRGAAGFDPPCGACLRRRIWSGRLACGGCGASHPIEEGIADFLAGAPIEEWVAAENRWWDDRYASRQLGEAAPPRRTAPTHDVPSNRGFERNRHLFAPLRARGLRGRWVLEIGAGISAYVARLLPPAAEGVCYVAVDVSREALRRGARELPEGEFVRCAADGVPFRAGSFDAVLSLGVLHHIPRWRESLLGWLGLLVSGGWLLFHEAIEKPRVLGRFREHSLTAASDSPHEGHVDLAELRAALEAKGRLLELRTGMTPLRVLLSWTLSGAMKRSLALTRLVLALDRATARSVGRVFPSLGPGEALGILEADGESPPPGEPLVRSPRSARLPSGP